MARKLTAVRSRFFICAWWVVLCANNKVRSKRLHAGTWPSARNHARADGTLHHRTMLRIDRLQFPIVDARTSRYNVRYAE